MKRIEEVLVDMSRFKLRTTEEKELMQMLVNGKAIASLRATNDTKKGLQ